MPKLILLVDDSDTQRAVLAHALRQLPDVVVEAYASGDELLRALTQVTPNLIVLDVVLPRPDGFDLLHDLPHVPLLLKSATEDAGGNNRANPRASLDALRLIAGHRHSAPVQACMMRHREDVARIALVAAEMMGAR